MPWWATWWTNRQTNTVTWLYFVWGMNHSCPISHGITVLSSRDPWFVIHPYFKELLWLLTPPPCRTSDKHLQLFVWERESPLFLSVLKGFVLYRNLVPCLCPGFPCTLYSTLCLQPCPLSLSGKMLLVDITFLDFYLILFLDWSLCAASAGLQPMHLLPQLPEC